MQCPCLRCKQIDCKNEVHCISYTRWLKVSNDFDDNEVISFLRYAKITETRNWQKKFNKNLRRDLKWSYIPVL